MFVFGIAILLGVGAGWLRGGTLRALDQVSVRQIWLLIAAVVLHQAVPYMLGSGPLTGRIEAAVLYAGVLAFLLLNHTLAGAALAAGGAAANGIASLVAGGPMPVWSGALGRVPPDVVAHLRQHGIATHQVFAHLVGIRWLGDILPLPAPLPPGVISVGDILLAIALAWFLCAAMKPAHIAV